MSQLSYFPPVPEDTRRAAGALFGKGNIYIKVGEELNELVSFLPPLARGDQGTRFQYIDMFYALVTVFQVAEELTDRQMVEALRKRVDLKYALHLPQNFPSLDPTALCEFRKHLFAEFDNQRLFQALLDSFTEFGVLNKVEGHALRSTDALEIVCTSMSIESVLETMNQALEILAAKHPDWLRRVALPHWYERYNRTEQNNYWPNSGGRWKNRIIDTASDIQYLLIEIDRSNSVRIAPLQEVEQLRRVLNDHFEVHFDDGTQGQEVFWRRSGCTSCNLNRD